ncbi:MAG: hypothetical protein WB870_07955 [Gallionellaceae bacterium]
MNNHIDYSSALTKVAKAQAMAILSGGEGLQERLEFIFQNHLKCRPQDFILAAAADYELVKRHTHELKPTAPGMYLKLLHGRAAADAEMDDWGKDGPWIGPLNWFHCTYLSDIGIGFAGGEELASQGYNIDIPSPIYLYQEMIYYDGMYYGSWELQNM